jgi:hypothetical protein
VRIGEYCEMDLDKKPDFIDILKRNNEEEIKEYLLRFCKQPKPISPFCYINTKEDNDNDSK